MSAMIRPCTPKALFQLPSVYIDIVRDCRVRSRVALNVRFRVDGPFEASLDTSPVAGRLRMPFAPIPNLASPAPRVTSMNAPVAVSLVVSFGLVHGDSPTRFGHDSNITMPAAPLAVSSALMRMSPLLNVATTSKTVLRWASRGADLVDHGAGRRQGGRSGP